MRFCTKWLPLVGVALVLPAQTPAPDSNFRIALTGDSIIDRRISVYDEPGYVQMFDRIRRADAAFTNFEMLIHNFEYPGAPMSGGTYMGAPAWVLDELKWAGFRLFAIANNHSFDFGTEGLLSNLRHMEQAGVVYAGAGENLARARAPGYLDTKKGRVALIGCASTFSPLSPAGEQRADMKGRPGLNPLRFKTTYTVEPLARSGGGAGPPGESNARNELRFLGATFRSGDKPGIATEPDPKDLKEIAAEVRDARRQADWVMVSIHAHEGAPGDREIPAEFLVTFAHAMIDAGADLFVGHGPHVLRAIEIYKGKPIFYDLGEFFREWDWSCDCNVSANGDITQAENVVRGLEARGVVEPINYESAIALSRLPGAEDKGIALESLGRLRRLDAEQALAAFCHALVNSAAFLYVD